MNSHVGHELASTLASTDAGYRALRRRSRTQGRLEIIRYGERIQGSTLTLRGTVTSEPDRFDGMRGVPDY